MFEVMTLLGRGITWFYVTFHDVGTLHMSGSVARLQLFCVEASQDNNDAEAGLVRSRQARE